jgi:hypothetical protein
MKRFIGICVLVCCVTGGLAAQSLRGKTVYLAVKNGQLKESTSFFARVKGTLDFGAACTVLRESGNWVEVKSDANPSLQGWISVSSVTTRRVVASSSSVQASADELALASKGFTEEVERAYREAGDLNYDAVDQMERILVPLAELRSFIIEGHLAGAEQ